MLDRIMLFLERNLVRNNLQKFLVVLRVKVYYFHSNYTHILRRPSLSQLSVYTRIYTLETDMNSIKVHIKHQRGQSENKIFLGDYVSYTCGEKKQRERTRRTSIAK